jgi:transposase
MRASLTSLRHTDLQEASMVNEASVGHTASAIGYFQGDVFVFIGKDRTRAKVLVWESTGFWLCAKRLETSRFQLPETVRGSGALPLSVAQVTALLDQVLPRQLALRR